MSLKKQSEKGNFIPRDKVMQHVALAAAQGVAAEFPGLEAWQRGSIRRRPLEIYDINGELLFLDYTIARGTEDIGTVRAAASKVLGPPVFAHQVGPRRWDYGAAVEKLAPKVGKEHPDWRLLNTKLVCYSYPKLGVMFSMVDQKKKPRRLIFDVASLDPVPEAPPDLKMEGAYAWSFYESLAADDREQRLKLYDEVDELRAKLPKEKQLQLAEVTGIAKLTDVVSVVWTGTITRELQFCTHYNYNEERSHHCFVLHGQQKSDYCAVATCQMILCYYRYYYTQDQIAPSLGYSSGSGCPSDQSAGYEALTCNHLDATYDPSATWEEARDQILALHPMKSGISGHARACAGYSYYRSFFGGVSQKKLYIYDPWPWNADYKLAGDIYWEDWTAVTHTNFVYTRIKCP